MSTLRQTPVQGRCLHTRTTFSGSNVHQTRVTCLACRQTLMLLYHSLPEELVQEGLRRRAQHSSPDVPAASQTQGSASQGSASQSRRDSHLFGTAPVCAEPSAPPPTVADLRPAPTPAASSRDSGNHSFHSPTRRLTESVQELHRALRPPAHSTPEEALPDLEDLSFHTPPFRSNTANSPESPSPQEFQVFGRVTLLSPTHRPSSAPPRGCCPHSSFGRG